MVGGGGGAVGGRWEVGGQNQNHKSFIVIVVVSWKPSLVQEDTRGDLQCAAERPLHD